MPDIQYPLADGIDKTLHGGGGSWGPDAAHPLTSKQKSAIVPRQQGSLQKRAVVLWGRPRIFNPLLPAVVSRGPFSVRAKLAPVVERAVSETKQTATLANPYQLREATSLVHESWGPTLVS